MKLRPTLAAVQCAIFNIKLKKNVLTNSHPNCKAAPRGQIQLHHEVDIDKNTEQGQPRQKRHLEEKTDNLRRGTFTEHHHHCKLYRHEILRVSHKHLEGERFFALRLPPDDDDTEEAQRREDGTHGHPHRMAVHQFVQPHGQHDAQHSDQHGWGKHGTQFTSHVIKSGHWLGFFFFF